MSHAPASGERASGHPAGASAPVALVGRTAWPFAPWLDGFLGTAVAGFGTLILALSAKDLGVEFATTTAAESAHVLQMAVGSGLIAVGGAWLVAAWWRLSTAGKLWLLTLGATVVGVWFRGLPEIAAANHPARALLEWLLAWAFAPVGGLGIAALTATLYRPLHTTDTHSSAADAVKSPAPISRLDLYR